MSDVYKKLTALKAEHGFVLVRATRHQIWKSRSGVVWVCASTPSDYRVAGNQLTSLKRAIREGNQSEIIAISQFERDEADAILEGQKKQEANRAGAAGTRKKSQGTGIWYIETGRTLEEMSPEAREAHLKASAEAAERQKQREALEREQRRSERFLLKDFLGFVNARIGAELDDDNTLYDTTLAYEGRAVRAMRRKLMGKKLTLVTMRDDNTGGATRDRVIQAMESILEDWFEHFVEKYREAAARQDESEWSENHSIPHVIAKIFTVGMWLENPGWTVSLENARTGEEVQLNLDEVLADMFVNRIEYWRSDRVSNHSRICEYIKTNALEFATAPSPDTVFKKVSDDIEAKTLDTKSYMYPDTVANLVTNAVVDWRLGWERKQSEKVCEQRVALDVMCEPRGPLDGVIFAARKMREDVQAMQETLKDFEKLIRKI